MWDKVDEGYSLFCANRWRMSVGVQGSAIQVVSSLSDRVLGKATIGLLDDEGQPISLPPCHECYARGDELHLVMPERTLRSARLDISLMIVEALEDVMVIEATIALQTDRLDARNSVQMMDEGLVASRLEAEHAQGTVWSNESCSDGLWLSVICDSRDHHCIDWSQSESGRLRFFGDFFEKGVIRKVQPWLVWTTQPLTKKRMAAWIDQLAMRPLPLSR